MMHYNSLMSYYGGESEFTKRALLIIQWMCNHPGDHTIREVKDGLGFSDMNSVRPRVTELVKKGVIVESGDVRCELTGKRVVKIALRRPALMVEKQTEMAL